MGIAVSEVMQYVPMSWEEYLALPEQNQPKIEYADGFAIVSPLAGFPHQGIVLRLSRLWEDSCPGLFVYPGGNLSLQPRRNRIPDALAFAQEQRSAFNDDIPVLVAEVLSPGTRREDLLRKTGEYAAGGVQQYWILDPDGPAIEVLRNVGGGWETLATFEERGPDGDVAVGEYGVVHIELGRLLH